MLKFMILAAAATASAAPTKPVLPVTPQLSAADCEDPGVRARKVREIASGSEAFGKAGKQFSEDWKAYTDYRIAKLGLSSEERKAFFERLSASPEFESLVSQIVELSQTMSTELTAMGQPKDERGQCLIAAKAFTYVPLLLAKVEQLMDLIDRNIEAEAARRGVSLI